MTSAEYRDSNSAGSISVGAMMVSRPALCVRHPFPASRPCVHTIPVYAESARFRERKHAQGIMFMHLRCTGAAGDELETWDISPPNENAILPIRRPAGS
jgi:hypothetical protein